MEKFILTLLVISVLSTGCKQNNTFTETNAIKTSIDKTEEDCISQNSSTAGMNECILKAENAWEREIEKYMALIKNITSKEDFKKIQLSQEKWELYKDSQMEVYNMIFPQGSMFQNISACSKKNLVKQRALALKSIYEILMAK